MLISKISYFSNNNKYKNIEDNNPTFGQRLPKLPVETPRFIHKLPCGCCGEPMIAKDELPKLLKSFMAGSKRALENSIIADKYNGTPEYEFLQQLSAIEPKKPIRELISVPENKIKINTLPEKTQIGIKHIALLSDGITVKAPKVIQKLSKFYDRFSKSDRELFDMMEVYSIQFPKKTFAEIFNLPEIFSKHHKNSEAFAQQTLAQKTNTFKKVRDLISELPDKRTVEEFQKAHLEAVKVLNGKFYTPEIKKGLIEEIYNKFLKENPQNLKITRKLKSIARSFPYETARTDDFIVNSVINRKTDLDIVKTFLMEFQSTFEHVHPKSQNGADSSGNGIFLCKKCNNERTDLPYPFFLRFHPEIKKNLQKQLNRIMSYIKHGKLPDYEDYPLEIKQTVWQETDHTIKLKIDEYLKYREEQAKSRLKTAKAKLAKNDEVYQKSSQQLEEIDKRIEEVMVVLRKLKKEKREVQKDFNEVAGIRQTLESKVSRKELELKYATTAVEDVKEADSKERAKRIKKIKTEPTEKK